jgi:hypothetical protein
VAHDALRGDNRHILVGVVFSLKRAGFVLKRPPNVALRAGRGFEA